MRLRQLNLTRFGHFTDFGINFGPSEKGKADLHVIFGPNEAGKTTAFEGYLDLLFGIPARTRYNFLHDYDNMRVGAELEIDGALVDLVRIKRKKHDLINTSGEPVSPTQLSLALDGIDRDQYRTMFSLDDETIEAGGNDILASEGNLGELLFSGAAGLSDLSSVLEAARAEVENFHKKRARKTELADAKSTLKDLRDKIKIIDVPASSYRKLKKDCDSAQKLMEKAKTIWDNLLEEKQRIDAIIECIPLMDDLQKYEDEVASKATYPTLPETWPDEADELKLNKIREETELRNSTLQFNAAVKKRDRLKIDEKILEAKNTLTSVLDTPKSRAQTAEEDLPRRETELNILVDEIAKLTGELELENAKDGVLSETLLTQLEKIAGQYSEAQTSLDAANRELANAKKDLGEFTNTDDPLRETISIDENLEEYLKEIEPEQLMSEDATANIELSSANSDMKKAFEKLKPWRGQIADLQSLSFSEREAKRIAKDYDDLSSKLNEANSAKKDAEINYEELLAQLKTVESEDKVSVYDDEKNGRAERDKLWKKHRQDLSEKSAEIFEDAMFRHDSLQVMKFNLAEKLARLNELKAKVAGAKTKLKTCISYFNKAEELMNKKIKTIAPKLNKLLLPNDFDPRDLPAWQSDLSDAQNCHSVLNQKQKEMDEAKTKLIKAKHDIKSSLGITNDELSFKQLLDYARAEVFRVTKERAQFEANQLALKRAKHEVKKRQTNTRKQSNKLSKIKESWKDTVSALPVALQDLEKFHWKVPALRSISKKDHEKSKLKRRIELMKTDYESFAKEIKKIAKSVDEPEGERLFILAERLNNRLFQAEKASEQLDTVTSEIEKAEKKVNETTANLSAINQRVKEMSKIFTGVHPIKDPDDLINALQQVTKVNLAKANAADIRQRIVTRLGADNIQEAKNLCAEQTIPRLEARREGLKTDLQESEAEYVHKVGDLHLAKDALEKVGGDDVPAKLEERCRTLLINLEDRARAAIQLRLGVIAAESALSKYRDSHRSKMLVETEDAFRTLTAGEYSKLQTQSDGQQEKLLAFRKRDGRSISVAEMSKGTRFQLYLSLRLAGYRQYSANGKTLPFIADDIMETFDNTRTAAALKLLKEVSLQGQALYFTHHEHVLDLAKDICGDSVMIHKILN